MWEIFGGTGKYRKSVKKVSEKCQKSVPEMSKGIGKYQKSVKSIKKVSKVLEKYQKSVKSIRKV